jgi:amino acid permease
LLILVVNISPHTTAQTGIRFLIVALIYALSMLVPDLGDLVNLVGGVASPLMGFILPPLFYIALQRSSASAALPLPTSPSSSFSPAAYVGIDRAASESASASASAFGTWSLIGHAAIVVFGVVAMCVSTYMTVDGILHPAPSA